MVRRRKRCAHRTVPHHPRASIVDSRHDDPPAHLLERGQSSVGAADHAIEVDVEHPPEELEVRQFLQLAYHRHARVVHQHVDPAIRCVGLFNQCPALRLDRDIGGNRHGLAAALPTIIGNRHQPLCVTCRQGQPGAFISELQGEGPPDPAGGAGDDDGLRLERIVAYLEPLWSLPSATGGREGRHMETKLLIRYAIRELLGLVVMGVALFWSAGRLDWWPAWAALAVMLAWILATAFVILGVNPALLAERLGPRQGAKVWDTVILSMLGLTQLARYSIAGLDQRFGWTGGLPFAAQLAALALCVLGYALVVWATASNAFFSQIVRIQSERGHTVATGGPYRYIRHPAYSGAIVYELAAPILLASWWALIISGVCVALLVLRTALEDRTLQAELPGYTAYARQTKHRLAPGIW